MGEGHSRATKTSKSRLGMGKNPSLSDFICSGRPPKFTLFDRKSRPLVLSGGFCSDRVLQGSLFFPSLLLLPFPSFPSWNFLWVLDPCRPVLWGVIVTIGVTINAICHQLWAVRAEFLPCLGALCQFWENRSRECQNFWCRFSLLGSDLENPGFPDPSRV